MKIKFFFFKSISIVISLIISILFLEILVRGLINFEIDYYYSPKNTVSKNIIRHPYGIIPINKYGYYDEEFDFNNGKTKIAYFGDSVTYGVGAGYPYRFTEYLENLNSEFDHINLSGGLGISLNNWNNDLNNFLILKKIKKVVYMMNLNDIYPLYQSKFVNGKPENSSNLISYKNFIIPFDTALRGRSALYTYVRLKIKNFLVKLGYEASGYKSIELFPSQNSKIIEGAAEVINNWQNDLKNIGIQSCVVILPYEMQISKDAANYYKLIGINFENSFSEFLTQKILLKKLQAEFNPFYIKDGFLQKNIGHYYVFNKGDKLDFNHPNREGHLVIAKEISKNKICQK